VSAMELWASPYTLQSLRTPNASSASLSRNGSLLRIVTETGVGYADLHPWPSLGDPSLTEQLQGLRDGRTTALSRRSLELAKIDLEFRALKRNAFQGLEIPESHFLIAEILKFTRAELASVMARGFRTLKIKMGRDISKELSQVIALQDALISFRLRFDFNGTLSLADFLEFAREFPESLRAQIDFIEDPMPWHAPEWQEAHARTGFPLAFDRLSDGQFEELERAPSTAYQWCILKPAIQEPDRIVQLAEVTGARLAVTSYMDHPLGQMSAAFEAARLSQAGISLGTCGLLTHIELEDSAWTRAIETVGPQLQPPVGFGFGFDSLLESADWERLR
jgi:O-succinylbenzoate synthase